MHGKASGTAPLLQSATASSRDDDAPFDLQFPGQCGELALGRLAQPSVGNLLQPDLSLRPGTRLVREWRGRTHTVVVTQAGFEYTGKAFPSLTKIAQAITGAHWSGPRFFGLTRKPASNGQMESDTAGLPAVEETANG